MYLVPEATQQAAACAVLFVLLAAWYIGQRE
jgi:hypothetical protein